MLAGGSLPHPTRQRWHVSVIADPSPPARTVLPDKPVLTKDRFGR
jgi:hypothetical protein